jgi:ribokinase
VSWLVVLGDVMMDVVARLSGPVVAGSDSPVSVSFLGGGSAANVAAWLAHAGAEPVLVGRVGDDERGAQVLSELRGLGVDAQVGLDPDLPTGTCIVLVAPSGERSMLPDAGANERLAAADLPDWVLAEGGHLHVTGYSLARPGPRPAALAAISRARTAGMGVSVDPSSTALLGPEFLDLAAEAELLLPNADEACVLARTTDPVEAAQVLATRFPEVVVKLGPEGALWTDGTEEVRVAAAKPPVDAAAAPPRARRGSDRPQAELDTTGAGDAFAAGLLAARYMGARPRIALTAGCKLAAEAVATPGARPRSGQR